MKYPLVKMYVDEEIRKKVLEILDSGVYIKGPESKKFEEEFASYIGARFGVSTSSGTTALWLIYDVLGIKNGAEFIAPSHTFIATVTPAIHMGAKPIFVDIDEETYTIDPEDVRKKITEKTKAIVIVHLYGHPADIKPLKELAEEKGLFLIEDCAQSHGAIYYNKKVGVFGEASAFSFFPSKVMTVAGDGGMVLTNDEDVANKVSILRNQGRVEKYRHTELGYNFRLSEILAGIGRIQLKHLENWIKRRNEIARIYDEILQEYVITPSTKEWARHVYYVYTIRVKMREKLRQFLQKNDIATGIYYPIPVHLQPSIKEKMEISKLPVTERIVKEILSIPMHPQLSDGDAISIAEKIVKFYKEEMK